MRPVALHLEGFGVFRAPVDVSFADIDYFALVGPTGAGKSTIIDALCFALYGSIPRYNDERFVGRVVSLGAQGAKVSLTFEVGGETYRATRVVKLQKGKTGGDALLERVLTDGTTETVAKNRSEMKPAVERLLGLPFAHFTKCVVLPQGEFARFLHDEPAKRRELLARLLDLDVYARIGQLARERAKEEAKAAELYGRQCDDLAFATAETRADAEQRVAALRGLYQAVDAARTADDTDRLAVHELAANVTRAETSAQSLAAVVIPADTDGVAQRLADAQSTVANAGQVLERADAAVTAAEADLAHSPDPTTLALAREAHAAIAVLELRAGSAGADLEQALAESARTEMLLARAHELVNEREQQLQDARDAHAAHALSAHLVRGQPCPVCAQPVVTVTKRRRPPALTKPDAALAEARTILTGAQAAHDSAARAEAVALAAKEQLHAQVESLRAAVAEHPDRARVEALLATIELARATLAAAQGEARRARTLEGEARSRLTAAQERAEQVRGALTRERDRLLRAGVEPPEPGGDVAADWQALARWAVEAHTGVLAVAARAGVELAAVRERQLARVRALVDSARGARIVTATSTLAAVRDDVIEQGTNARAELQRIDDALESAAKLREQADAARADSEVARLLGELLRSDRFEKWILAEALAALVESASHTLFALSQGQFSLQSSAEEEFVVVDHGNADETRSVRTLSGGETFQASLALALALSDQLAALSAAGGVKLDAIFLDEGFGTLDADTLDAVASGIEALGTDGRMVGLVTHVPALAERVPVRFRVHDGTVTREES